MPELIVRREGRIGWILFSNPAKHNAVTYEMLNALPGAVEAHERDRTVRVIALAGEGKSFVSGADLSEYASIRGSHYAASSYGGALESVYSAFAAARKPTLAKIHGACMGIGLTIALCCDVRMVAENARVSHPAARFGLGISWTSMRRLVALVGPGDAADLIFTARAITGQKAYKMGIASRVAADAELDKDFADYCGAMADAAPLTLAAAKRAIVAALADPAERNLKELQAIIEACNASDDYKEGLAALRDKRAPQFKGR